jgi:hypothetical protein
MPILNVQRRLREAGRIRIGQQVATNNGRRRPVKLDRFRVTSQDRDKVERVARIYGGQPTQWADAPIGDQWEVVTEATALQVIVPPSAMAFSQWMEQWSGGGCTRRCDTETEMISGGPCICAAEDAPGCKPTTRLSVMLRDLDGLGVWRLETHGHYAAAELAGVVDIIQAAASAGRLLPAVLGLEQRQVKRIVAGKPQTMNFAVPTLDVRVSFDALAVGSAGAPMAALEAPSLDLPERSWSPMPAAELPPGPSVAEQLTAPKPEPKRTARSAPPIPATSVPVKASAPGGSHTPAQMRMAQALAKGQALDDKARHDLASVTTGREVTTWSDLTFDEMSLVIEALKDMSKGQEPF